MTNRHCTTDLTGPIVLNASILGIDGHITVNANEGCDRASITIRTNDETGPAADAVRSADLGQEGGYLVARVTGEGHGTLQAQTVVTRGGRTTVMNGTVNGTVIGGNVAGVVIVNGKVVSGGHTIVQEMSPVEITVTVPVGSSVAAQVDSASVTTSGPLAQVAADTQSGGIDVEQARTLRAKTLSGCVDAGLVGDVNADTMSGRIAVHAVHGAANLKSMSGSITAHAVNGHQISADTMSGSVEITATRQAIEQGLRVRADSMSGRVQTPSQCGR